MKPISDMILLGGDRLDKVEVSTNLMVQPGQLYTTYKLPVLQEQEQGLQHKTIPLNAYVI